MSPRRRAFLFLFLAILLYGAASADRTRAACATPATSFTGYSYVVSPGANTPASIESSFWALGYGHPDPGLGVDNGGWEDSEPPDGGWLRRTTVNYLAGAWSSSAEIDGCIDGRVAPGKLREIMLTSFTDMDSLPRGHFAIAAVQRSPEGLGFDFTFPGRDIALVPIPSPQVVGATRTGPHQVQAQMRGPLPADVAAGLVGDGSVTVPEVILGFRVYGHDAASPGVPPPDRNDAGWVPLSAPAALGQTVSVNVDCGCSSISYLALSLIFDGGFETRHLSRPIPITCSPPLCEYWPWPDFDEDGYTLDPCCGLGLDCDDGNPDVHPGAVEVCNGIDDDCDARVDEDAEGEDSDLDQIHNLCDNCVHVPNASQHDLDSDSEGDACDLDDGWIHLGLERPDLLVWQREAAFLSWNAYRGDLEVLKATGAYTQIPGSNQLADRGCGLFDPMTSAGPSPLSGKVAFFLVSGSTAAGEGGLGTDSRGIERPNTHPCP